MLSNKYATPLKINLKPSRKLFAFILACHGLAFISILMLPLWLSVVPGIAISLSLVYNLKQQGYISASNKIDQLVLGTDNLWTIIRRDGSKSVAQLKPDTYVNPFVVVLCLATEGEWVKHRVVIMSDAIDRHVFRRLRLHLNTQS